LLMTLHDFISQCKGFLPKRAKYTTSYFLMYSIYSQSLHYGNGTNKARVMMVLLFSFLVQFSLVLGEKSGFCLVSVRRYRERVN